MTGESVYPAAKDDLPTFTAATGVEMSGEMFNRLASSLEAIEGALGGSIEGTKTDLLARLAINLATDGTFPNTDTGVVTGNPRTAGAGIAVVFTSTFTQIPHVFVQFNQLGTAYDESDQGFIAIPTSITTLGFTIFAKRANGGNVSTSPDGDGRYGWMAWARETVTPSIYE